VESAELRIESLAAGGDGVGRLPDGRVVFVPFSAPGDRVRVRLVESRGRFARGRVEELLEAGPDRVEPVCPVFGSCGGCAWQHVAYPAQLEAKRAILADALRRIGGFAEEPTTPQGFRSAWPSSTGAPSRCAAASRPGPPPIVPSPAPYAYRGRTRVLVEAGRVGYRRRRSHALCAVSRCPVLVAPLEDRLHELASHPPTRDGEWELACGSGEVRAAPVGARGGPRIHLEVEGRRIGFSAGVFVQSNALLLAELAARVAAAAGSGRLAVELFAGAGLLTVGLASRFARVVAVEHDRAAVRDLRHNLAEAELHNVEVVGGRVERALPTLAGLGPEALLLDPPRTGLPRGSAGDLAAVGPERIVYLSCDPATLARDLSELCACGFALHAVEAIDLFPQTPHVEALATLVCASEARSGPQAREGPRSANPQPSTAHSSRGTRGLC
jgi:23S rRNA (uracil1939-C5)-methyltransferase